MRPPHKTTHRALGDWQIIPYTEVSWTIVGYRYGNGKANSEENKYYITEMVGPLWLDLTWQPVVDSIEITCDSTRLDKLVTRLDLTWHNLVTRLDSTRQSWHNLVTRLDLTCLQQERLGTCLRLGTKWLELAWDSARSDSCNCLQCL